MITFQEMSLQRAGLATEMHCYRVPQEDPEMSKRIKWSIVSKAAKKLKSTRMDTSSPPKRL